MADDIGLTDADRERLAELADTDLRYSQKIEKTCAECGKVFSVSPSMSDQRFCSWGCAGEAKSQKIEKACEECGKVFSVIPSLSDQRFCSRGCAGEAKSQKIEKTCAECGKVFSVSPSLSDQRFCSVACSNRAGYGGRPPRETDNE